jgi:hypothetical protein
MVDESTLISTATDQHQTAIRDFIANNRGRHGTHRYTLEQYGLDPAQERKRYRFYQEYFHVADEA